MTPQGLLSESPHLWVETPVVFTSTPKAQPVTVGSFDATGDVFVHWNQMCAGALVAALPGVIFVFLAQKYLSRGLTTGAIKS